MTDYKESRSGTDRRQMMDFCEHHDDNTKELTSLKSSISTLKWIISVGLPVFCLLIGSWVGGSYDTLKESLGKIENVTTETKTSVNRMEVSQAVTQQQMDQARRDIEDINYRIRSFHEPDNNRNRSGRP